MSDETPVMNPVLALSDPATHVMTLPEIPSRLMVLWRAAGLKSLEEFQAAPNRIRACPRLNSVDSFCEFVNRFASPASSIYLDVYGGTETIDHGRRATPPRFVAVLDHHDKDSPAWGDFSAVYTPRLSMEWQAWRAFEARGYVTQEDLILFLEDHYGDIQTPEPSSVLTAAMAFEAVETHKYVSHRNLDNGQVQFTFNKDGATSAVVFPHRLTLSLPIVEGSVPRTLDARLRYRSVEGVLRFQFQFTADADRCERDAYRAEAGVVRSLCGSLKLYEGMADARRVRIE